MPRHTISDYAAHRYAIKFELDAPGAVPTDESLRDTLASCALPPRPDHLPAIRAAVYAYRDTKAEHRQDGQDELDRETAERYDRALGQGRH